jgi:hypothetical protein
MNDIVAVHGKRRTVHEYDGASGRSPCGHVLRAATPTS